MELLLNSSVPKAGSGKNHEIDSFEPGGILKSKYQTIVELTHNASSANSLYRLKQGIKTQRYHLVSSAETLLKLSIFTAVILSIFN